MPVALSDRIGDWGRDAADAEIADTLGSRQERDRIGFVEKITFQTNV
jgi:hypothetical protein